MKTFTINEPVPFQGTEEQKRKNFETHNFVGWDMDYRCAACDCKPHHKAANYPCGVEPPRQDIIYMEV